MSKNTENKTWTPLPTWDDDTDCYDISGTSMFNDGACPRCGCPTNYGDWDEKATLDDRETVSYDTTCPDCGLVYQETYWVDIDGNEEDACDHCGCVPDYENIERAEISDDCVEFDLVCQECGRQVHTICGLAPSFAYVPPQKTVTRTGDVQR